MTSNLKPARSTPALTQVMVEPIERMAGMGTRKLVVKMSRITYLHGTSAGDQGEAR